MSEENCLTKIDVLKMIKVIKINYNAYNGVSEKDMEVIIDCWYERLKQYHKQLVFAAFRKILDTSKHVPVLANFIEQIDLMQDSTGKSEQELWLELCKAAHTASILAGRLNYDGVPLGETKTQGELSREALDQLFADLDPILKEYVSSIQGLLNFAYTDLDYAETRFKRALPQIKARLRTQNEMSETVKDILNQSSLKRISNDS